MPGLHRRRGGPFRLMEEAYRLCKAIREVRASPEFAAEFAETMPLMTAALERFVPPGAGELLRMVCRIIREGTPQEKETLCRAWHAHNIRAVGSQLFSVFMILDKVYCYFCYSDLEGTVDEDFECHSDDEDFGPAGPPVKADIMRHMANFMNSRDAAALRRAFFRHRIKRFLEVYDEEGFPSMISLREVRAGWTADVAALSAIQN